MTNVTLDALYFTYIDFFAIECSTGCIAGCGNQGATKCDSNNCDIGYFYDAANFVCLRM